MEVVILPTSEDCAEIAATAIERLVHTKPSAVLGVATGSTPIPLYRRLIRGRHSDASLSYANVHAVLLDEYVGLGREHPQSYRATIRQELTDALGIPDHQVHAPDGTAEDLQHEGQRYEAQLAAVGGVDIQILGIGSDGHLAFNEPGSSLTSRTRLKTLTARTREDNARFFGNVNDVPHHVLTQGLGTILEARHLILLASGTSKAQAVRDAVEGPLTAQCPASVLQWHPHVTVLLDRDAASLLSRAEYYRYTWAHKPAWQGI